MISRCARRILTFLMKWTVAKRARDKWLTLWPQHLAAFDEIAIGPLDLTKSFPGAFESLGKLFHSAPATKSLKPRPALWIPTLAMKLQKPCPERRPLAAARLSSAASKRKADGLLQASASNAANFGLHCCSLEAGNVSATPSDEIAAACASTMAQRSLEDVTAVSPCRRKQSRTPTQFGQRATAPVRSEALGPSRRSCNFQAAALGSR